VPPEPAATKAAPEPEPAPDAEDKVDSDLAELDKLADGPDAELPDADELPVADEAKELAADTGKNLDTELDELDKLDKLDEPDGPGPAEAPEPDTESDAAAALDAELADEPEEVRPVRRIGPAKPSVQTA